MSLSRVTAQILKKKLLATRLPANERPVVHTLPRHQRTVSAGSAGGTAPQALSANTPASGSARETAQQPPGVNAPAVASTALPPPGRRRKPRSASSGTGRSLPVGGPHRLPPAARPRKTASPAGRGPTPPAGSQAAGGRRLPRPTLYLCRGPTAASAGTPPPAA